MKPSPNRGWHNGPAVRTKVEELPESRVRLEVEVPETDVRHAIEHAASDLSRSLSIPGFRRGKVPLPVVLARVGREAVWEEALRSHLDSWFWSAAATTGIRPVGRPEVELDGPPDDGAPFRFAATVPVLPKPDVVDWTALEVPAEEAAVLPELVDEELDRMRAAVAELVPVDRPVAEGDTVVLDLESPHPDVPAQRDYVTEVGSGRLVEEIEQALVGMSPGETKEVELQLDEERTIAVAVTTKEVKEKSLPPLDDELARQTSEFETLEELRREIEGRLGEAIGAEAEAAFRESAVDALVSASQVAGAEPLVEQRAAALWTGFVRTLEQRGVTAETYLRASGQTQDEVLARMREEADRAVKRELVLDAVADQLGIEVADEEVEEVIRRQAAEEGEEPEPVLAALRERGGFEQLRADLRLKKALDEVVSGVKRIPVDLALAREKLWTPEKEKGGSGMKIWTPGSEEVR